MAILTDKTACVVLIRDTRQSLAQVLVGRPPCLSIPYRNWSLSWSHGTKRITTKSLENSEGLFHRCKENF
ncbi:hypothetical protein BDE02_18G072900 [Populus trichocarpa]|nr:hypothetical protein BDE02_18G072900 [Populus trichocarpa]